MQGLLNNLNRAQREAVENLSGPLLILAGAGSGKTRVLTFRIANLIAQGLARPDQILAVTFTNKAAREMESRALHLLQELGIVTTDRLWISTFHSTCVRILRAHAEELGYRSFFGIYDSADQLSMIKKVLAALNIDEKIHPAKAFQARIGMAKQLALEPDEVEIRAGSRGFLMDDISLKVYRRYTHDMQQSNNMDFDDLLLKTYQLFRDHPEVLKKYQQKFKYILIDEYQDTNNIQYRLVYQLARSHGNLCVVGDEDQSIYSWRGADITNILNFEKDFPDCAVIKLEQNYRSTQTIVKAASFLIQNNTQRKDKTLFTENPSGDPIIIQEEGNEYDEGRFVATQIQSLMQDGTRTYSDFAVFYRTNAQSRVLEEQLRTRNIPYKIVGGLKFYDRMEIKDVLAYLKLVLNVKDDVALKRIINVPARGIGKTTVNRIEEIAHSQNISLYEATRWAAEHREFNAGTCKKLVSFLNLLDELIAGANGIPPSQAYHLVLDKTNYVQILKQENTPEAESRIENLEEFDNAIAQFEKERADDVQLQAFLEEMALISDIDTMEDQENSITLMTLHISKGLEFPFVFIVGLEEGLFPTARSFDSLDPTSMEEERRLAYVGMTRARERLFLTYCRLRRMWGEENHNPPSRFLKEIPSEYVQFGTAIQRPQFLERYQKYIKPEHEQEKPSAWDREPSAPRARGSYRGRTPKSDGYDSVPSYEDFTQDENTAGGTAFVKGMKVRHPTYGVGSIFESEGTGETQKVSVVFADHSVKKFVVKYARLAKA